MTGEKTNFKLEGVVTKVLDNKEFDNEPHQRFVVSQESGLTVLTTINLIKGKKLTVAEGDAVRAIGTYVWDSRGGYLHKIYGEGFAQVLGRKVAPFPRCLAAHRLFHAKQSNQYIEVEGRVSKILIDDADTTPHQKFIIKTELDQSIMVIVNLDHMPRINVESKDYVEVAGVYVWNKFGGLVHITHHDHFKTHPEGWIYVPRLGKVFQ